MTSARDWAETDCWEEDEAGKIELSYSPQKGINRARPAHEMLVLCII